MGSLIHLNLNNLVWAKDWWKTWWGFPIILLTLADEWAVGYFSRYFPEPSKSFERKTICSRFPRPDVDAAYTPMLEINSNPKDQYRVSGVFCGINEFNSFPPSTQIQKGQKGMSSTVDQSHPNNQGTFQTPRTPHFLHPGCFPSKGVTCKVERQGNLALSTELIT